MAKANRAGKSEKLSLWQKRLSDSDSAYSAEVSKMDDREKLYKGSRELKPLVPGDHKKNGELKKTSHVRNIVFENIETQVSSSIPQPKVTARRKQDEPLAEIIERFLRNEIDRMPFEEINDLAERTVPIQGGTGFLVEWDNSRRTNSTVGEVVVSMIHPKQFAPQPGIYTGIRDMDWFIIKVPTTKEAVKRKYGVDVRDESEAEPDVRSAETEGTAEDAVTQYIGYEINASGGISRYSWVNDVELEDLKDYQARRQPVCKKCGRVRPLPGQIIGERARDTLGPESVGDRDAMAEAAAGRELAGWLAARQADPTSEGGALLEMPFGAGTAPETEPERYRGGPCPWCGSEEFADQEQEFEQVIVPIYTARGLKIPGMHPGVDEDGNAVMQPTPIPFYKPDVYPVVLQRSVSEYGQLLGSSDVDMIADQQNTINRIEQKIIDRLIKAGSRITLPDKASLRTDPEDGERWFLDNPADKQMIGVYSFSGDLKYETAYLANVYEEARQILGITDSFQGRRDTTATSGTAKEFSAAQAAGRLESKRVMKNAAYASMYELMFKFWLAYSDEPRPVSYKNFKGETEYQEFNRYDFLERDEDGNFWWNDQFLFSCDTTDSLTSNREAMWQETRMNLQTGAFGDPAAVDTLILFWSKMEELHYPGAAATKKFLEDRKAQEQQMQQQQQQQMAAQPSGGGQMQIPGEVAGAVEERARRDAAAAVKAGRM